MSKSQTPALSSETVNKHQVGYLEQQPCLVRFWAHSFSIRLQFGTEMGLFKDMRLRKRQVTVDDRCQRMIGGTLNAKMFTVSSARSLFWAFGSE